jgi:hypothetical protein
LLQACECCDNPADYTILLGTDPYGRHGFFYLPDQQGGNGLDEVIPVPFCELCLVTIEDRLRATIARLKDKAARMRAGLTSKKPRHRKSDRNVLRFPTTDDR